MASDSSRHFASGAVEYDRFRPHYPDALFEHLAGLLERHELAWDCATGTGQAVAPLAVRFRQLVASDVSLAQVAAARVGPNVLRIVAPAERVPLAAGCVDLITVAQALHWFELPAFFAEARRVLQRQGVLAAWTYGLIRVDDRIDGVLQRFYRDTLGAYWPPERRLVDEAYARVKWPAGEIETHTLDMSAQWDCEHLQSYLGTWSAIKQYRQARGVDPLPAVAAALREAWGDGSARTVTWPLTLITVRLDG